MKIFKRVLAALAGVFILFYIASAVLLASSKEPLPDFDGPRSAYDTIAIFGASGTAGDGILKAALADPTIRKIHVITRRTTPRIDAGVAAGKVEATIHMDYLDYDAIRPLLADVDATYWAIGLSSLGVDEETYAMIHVDFPARFVETWMDASNKLQASFHYISSSDISEDSTAMWAREKYRAEQTLFALAEGSTLKVIAYRPDYIGPTSEEAHLGQNLLYGFFAPVGVAVKARQIGEAMLEASSRIASIGSGERIATQSIIRYSEAYRERLR